MAAASIRPMLSRASSAKDCDGALERAETLNSCRIAALMASPSPDGSPSKPPEVMADPRARAASAEKADAAATTTGLMSQACSVSSMARSDTTRCARPASVMREATTALTAASERCCVVGMWPASAAPPLPSPSLPRAGAATKASSSSPPAMSSTARAMPVTHSPSTADAPPSSLPTHRSTKRSADTRDATSALRNSSGGALASHVAALPADGLAPCSAAASASGTIFASPEAVAPAAPAAPAAEAARAAEAAPPPAALEAVSGARLRGGAAVGAEHSASSTATRPVLTPPLAADAKRRSSVEQPGGPERGPLALAPATSPACPLGRSLRRRSSVPGLDRSKPAAASSEAASPLVAA
mmetsp:Transcript_1268/g.4979  ORF Transcript_1268/g.4979 Transcript_1268/m.4979 type:complete len:357 (+) Transcript_1268:6373-7443(+)